jgi:hypothetical protein
MHLLGTGNIPLDPRVFSSMSQQDIEAFRATIIKQLQLNKGNTLGAHLKSLTPAELARDMYTLDLMIQNMIKNRNLVKSHYCVIRVPEINFQILEPTQGEIINTIEDVLSNTFRGITESQPNWKPSVQKIVISKCFCTSLFMIKHKGLEFTFLLLRAILQ